MKKQNNGWAGGVPTGPDVQRINKVLPPAKMQEGDLIPYDQIAGIVGVEVDSNRFRTVSTAWRKHLLNSYHLLTECEGRSFKILNDSEKVRSAKGRINKARTQFRFGLKTCTIVNPAKLDEPERRLHENNQQVTAAALGIFKLTRLRGKNLPSLIAGEEE